MSSDFNRLFHQIFADNDLVAYDTSAHAHAFEALTTYMLEVNAHMNLTAITEVPAIIAKHYADSILVAEWLPSEANVVDVGCGAGFPSLPLAIVRPDLHITALDSTAKRVSYVADAAKLLSLAHVRPLCDRAEEAGAPDSALREQFDVVLSRAVANLPVLAELCLPFVKVGGLFVAMKAQRAAEEVEAAKSAIATLGGRLSQVAFRTLTLPDGEKEERNLIIIEKIGKTPKIYPRNFAQIKKKPL